MRSLCALPQRLLLLALLLLALLVAAKGSGAPAEDDPGQVVGEFLLLLLGSDEGKREALDFVDDRWQENFTPFLLEVLTFNRDQAFGLELVELLQRRTGQSFGLDLKQWQRWLWNQPPRIHPQYSEFKRALYGLIDPRFEDYFSVTGTARIRLDEVLWGGVEQDGIPPLRNPQMIQAGEAAYLADSDIVFGLEVNGDLRAYPRRILAWHEMFTDHIGGVPVVGVYCTLCGTMILYNTRYEGVVHALGTSGFLYRSNKLMYDKASSSLWNTLWGTPVIGPLAGRDISLERMSVVTTTWGEWRRRHPSTSVLSLETGHLRDYAEGAAYREYFATDELMFPVPKLDDRLNNKDEILGLVFPLYPSQPLAISAEFLARHPLYHDAVGDLHFVVLTDKSGANRVYASQDVTFTEWDGGPTIGDSQGSTWRLQEAQLSTADGRVLPRLPAHRAFWFGWYSAYNHTRLVN